MRIVRHRDGSYNFTDIIEEFLKKQTKGTKPLNYSLNNIQVIDGRPDATKLPVRLAVALLKDRKGEIHLDLPLTGQIDDPKFSVWGIVVKIIVNLLVKAATSPFALLGAIFGGGEELSYLEFDPGTTDLPGTAETKSGSGRIPEIPRAGVRGGEVPEAEERPRDGQGSTGGRDGEIDADAHTGDER